MKDSREMKDEKAGEIFGCSRSQTFDEDEGVDLHDDRRWTQPFIGRRAGTGFWWGSRASAETARLGGVTVEWLQGLESRAWAAWPCPDRHGAGTASRGSLNAFHPRVSLPRPLAPPSLPLLLKRHRSGHSYRRVDFFRSVACRSASYSPPGMCSMLTTWTPRSVAGVVRPFGGHPLHPRLLGQGPSQAPAAAETQPIVKSPPAAFVRARWCGVHFQPTAPVRCAISFTCVQ